MVAAIQVAGSFMAVLSFGLVLEMPRKYLGWSGLTGTGSMILGAFLSSLSVALMGHLFARIFRAPVSVFLVPGILPLVPGTSIYNSVYYVIRNSREESMYYLVETLQIAGAIALAVFLMDSVFKLVGKKKRIKV